MDQQQLPEMEIYEAQLVEIAQHHAKGDVKLFNPLIIKQIKCLNEYELGKKIGQGSFGKVKQVTRSYKENENSDVVQKEDYAMKVVKIKFIFHKDALKNQRTIIYEENGKDGRMSNNLEFAYKEIQIWKNLDHPNISKLYQIIDDEDDIKGQLYLITQLGDLGCIMNYNEMQERYIRSEKVFNYIQEQFKVQNLEDVAKIIFKQIAQGIQYLHQEFVVHRDIKVDNVICSTKYDKTESIKIIDFTTSRNYLDKESICYDCAGTPCFRAPEIQFNIEEGYSGIKCDVWSYGITLYTYLTQNLPFVGECELMTDILARDKPLPDSNISKQGKDLLEKCCNKDPNKRPNFEEILCHQWFNISQQIQ